MDVNRVWVYSIPVLKYVEKMRDSTGSLLENMKTHPWGNMNTL